MFVCHDASCHVPIPGSDELSISSSSGGSRGASRTPSPFSLSSSGASSAGPNHPHLGNHIQSTNKYGSSATSAPTEHFIGTAADTYVGATTPDPAREGGQTEVYSRKVFVGGLPPDIDQGIVDVIFCVVESLLLHCILFFPSQMKSRNISSGLAPSLWTGHIKPNLKLTFHLKVLKSRPPIEICGLITMFIRLVTTLSGIEHCSKMFDDQCYNLFSGHCV